MPANYFLISALATVIVCGAGAATASEIFDPNRSGCTGVNCSSVTLSGTYFNHVNASAKPWVIQAYGETGECLRFQILSEDRDLEMVVTTPNGTVYRNDDGLVGSCTNCPLVKVGSASNNGWNTVQIAHFAGLPTEANFALAYGRYPAGNPNCSTATPPTAASVGKR